jgi:hypothetical protein
VFSYRLNEDPAMMASAGDEGRLAAAILDGARRRRRQLFGAYFDGTDSSDAFGAAYEGIYRLPVDATGIRPKGIYRFFDCLDNVVRRCPDGCGKRLLLDSLLIHLNDDHQWSRERIARWLAGEADPARATG